MRDKKIEQSIKGIALILLFCAFVFHTPLSVGNSGDKIVTPPDEIINVEQQKEDSCLSAKFEENLYSRFMFEKVDSLFYEFDTPRD